MTRNHLAYKTFSSQLILDILNKSLLCSLKKSVRQLFSKVFDAYDFFTVNMSPRFDCNIVISQSARAHETRRSFDRQFYRTFQNLFLSVNFSHTQRARSVVRE